MSSSLSMTIAELSNKTLPRASHIRLVARQDQRHRHYPIEHSLVLLCQHETGARSSLLQ
jgi:hypothetical protein